MTRRWTTAVAAGATVLLGAGTAFAATPGWHPVTKPTAPSGGAQPTANFRIAIGAGSSGQATILYQAVKGAIYAVSRTSKSAAWGSAQPWASTAALGGPESSGNGGLEVAVGSKVSALWVNTSAVLRTATGTASSGGGIGTVPTPANNPIAALTLFSVPQGLAYSYQAGVTPYGGSAPARSPLPAAPVIPPTGPGASPNVQTGVDSQGNQTAAWVQNNAIQVATRAAGTSTWTAPVTLPGSSGGPFALTVATNGKAAVAYTGNVTQGVFSGVNTLGQPLTLEYQSSASLLVVTRPSAPAPFGPPQTLYQYLPATPLTLDAATALLDNPFPTAVSAATGGGKLVVGAVAETILVDAPQYLVTRGTLGSTLPSPTVFLGPDEDATSFTLTGLTSAVDPQGNAVVAIGSQLTQGNQGTVVATTSTPDAPTWKTPKNVAGCSGSEGVSAGPRSVAAPTGGVLLTWGCEAANAGGSSAQGLVGVTAFDTQGPPVISFSLSGKTARFTLGEAANYSLTAVKGGTTVKVTGSARARSQVTRTLNLGSGTWKVTLKAVLSGSGNSTSQSKNTTVGG